MRIRILCIGKLKERFYKDACAEFCKRLSRYATLEIIELPDEKAPEQLSQAQKEQVKAAEGSRMLARLGEGELAVALDIAGEQLSSPQLASRIQGWLTDGKSRLSFLIGGSLGFSPAVLSRADARISFGPPTFSHQLFRVMLLEQLYRACKINAGEPYHK
ncbi:MAG: 23S rRNA (pseudouridine(1915)-N(3))-methyltransferase RlmH [Candidatus Pelethousia sp.]|nr:23S rRNA (pseudouridine(1915)-N(3))-methyltransferase RlmH [Candidatus Pelethousia sp.]